MKPKRWMSQLVLYFMFMFSIWGCSTEIKQQSSWISVEKPPIRIIYVNKAGAISDATVTNLVRQATGVRYKDYSFNENVGVSINANASRSIVDTETDSTSVSVSTNK